MAAPRSLTLTHADHLNIQKEFGIRETEDYGVVTHRGKGLITRSVHVFARQPSTKEINDYEQTASRVKFRGQRAELEGSQIRAAVDLYGKLIDRVFNLPVGLQKYDKLTRDQAVETVPALVKREAVRDSISEVYSATRLADAEGEDEVVEGAKEED